SLRLPPRSTLFPYTTLFRSSRSARTRCRLHDLIDFHRHLVAVEIDFAPNFNFGIHRDAVAREVVVVELDFDLAGLVREYVIIASEVAHAAAPQPDILIVLPRCEDFLHRRPLRRGGGLQPTVLRARPLLTRRIIVCDGRFDLPLGREGS